jgi:ATP-dependent exoDNAse (exonuclease V) beta subunit
MDALAPVVAGRIDKGEERGEIFHDIRGRLLGKGINRHHVGWALRDAFDAREASTDTTHRNAPAIVDVLNRCLPPWMPHYRVQATAAHTGPGLFWRLPLIEREATASVANVPFDWLEPRAEDDASPRYREGLAIADAIERARAVLAGQGAPVPYGSIYLLARSRTQPHSTSGNA